MIFVIFLYYFVITFLFYFFYSIKIALVTFFFLSVLLIVFLRWADKVILIFTFARYVNADEALISRVQNLCTLLKISGVNVYWSDVFKSNVYFASSYWGKSSIVIGRDVYRNFSANELISLIYASLLRIKSNEAKRRTLVAVLLAAYYAPVYAVRFALGRSFHDFDRGNYFFKIFSYMIISFKLRLYAHNKELIVFDQKVAQFYNLRKDYLSAIYKLGHLSLNAKGMFVGELLITGLCHAQNSYNEVIGNILLKKSDLDLRVRALNNNSQLIYYE